MGRKARFEKASDGKEIRNNYTFVSNSPEGRQVNIRLPEKLFADFVIKINNEMIPFRRFIRLMVEGYLEDDERLLSYINDALKTERPKYQVRVIERENKIAKKTEEVFGLSPDEIEDIYDIMEEEFDV